jgi:SWI/SNF-related matrix-associated actin-dependent regulator of chromatin subfamily A3
MDKKVVRTEALVVGSGNQYTLPIRISIFGLEGDYPTIFKSLSYWFKPDVSRSKGGVAESPGGGVYKRVRKIDVLDECEKLFAQLSNSSLVEAAQPKKVKTELLPHQAQALSWMLEKEKGFVPPFWTEKTATTMQGKQMRGWFCSLTNSLVPQKPKEVVGGILADDMGLGKTLTCLSLIVTSPTKGPTLVVAPASLLENWKGQAAEHLQSSFQCLIYHGADRDRNSKKIAQNDLVVTTYATLAAEHGNSKNGLFGVSWDRVILDEAHQIRNMTAQSQKLLQLRRRASWSVTGTPIQNSVNDFRALLEFLQVDPLLEPVWWTRCIESPLKKGSEAALAQLRLLIMAITLRRTKESKGPSGEPLLLLPPKEILERTVILSSTERKAYDSVQKEARQLLRLYTQQQKGQKGMSIILVALLRLRQLCDHGSLAPDALKNCRALVEEMEKAVISDEAASRALKVIEESDGCPICLEDNMTDERVSAFGFPCH